MGVRKQCITGKDRKEIKEENNGLIVEEIKMGGEMGEQGFV